MSNTDPIPLSSAERKALRGQAMRLKPALIIGRAGVTTTVVQALETALFKEALVKVRIEAPDRATRREWLAAMAAATASTVCGEVGHTASLYRPKPSPGCK